MATKLATMTMSLNFATCRWEQMFLQSVSFSTAMLSGCQLASGSFIFVGGTSCGIRFKVITAMSTIKNQFQHHHETCNYQTCFVHQTVQNYLNCQYVCPMSHPQVPEMELSFVYMTLLYTAETQNVHSEHKSISLIYYLCSLKLYKFDYFVCYS